MPSYQVELNVEGTVSIVVDADSESEAADIATNELSDTLQACGLSESVRVTTSTVDEIG